MDSVLYMYLSGFKKCLFNIEYTTMEFMGMADLKACGLRGNKGDMHISSI